MAISNKGIAETARATGLSKARVTQLMNSGMTSDQIKKRGRLMNSGQKGKGVRIARDAAISKQAAALGKTYVPPRVRHLEKLNGKSKRQASQSPPEITSSSMFDAPAVPPELEMEAKARLTIAQANEREIIVAKAAGNLVTIVAVNNWFGTVIIKIRDRLLRLSGELAEGLAAEENPAAVEQLLKTEIIRVLDMAKLMGREGEAVDVA